MIAFLGTGLIGTGFVRAMRRRGEEVHVWNRSPAKARALEGDGARAFDDPAGAVRGASRVHLSLSDDAAVDDVLERARPGLGKDAVLVDHTTTSPTGTVARAARWQERGVPFLHAPVFMGPQNALEGTGVMLASGDAARYEALARALAKMTGKVVYLGPQVDRAAQFKLLGNLFLMFLTTGVADLFALAKAFGVTPSEAASLFEHFNPGATIAARAKRMMESASGQASWELSMARKDARLMLEEAERAGGRLAVLPAIAAEMDRWIQRGHGHDDWTVVGRDSI
ncbi:MAG TPA: NAD(P)-dependent oxidoreductase [Polyangiaceae bacterium]|nr:NAD(P)-dependent oxidoreductase [Polyangiaceae bacterium]